MPEVGGKDCDYFDPHDPTDIARALERLIFDDVYLAKRTKAIDRSRLWSWRDSAADLLNVLSQPAEILDLRHNADGSRRLAPLLSTASHQEAIGQG